MNTVEKDMKNYIMTMLLASALIWGCNPTREQSPGSSAQSDNSMQMIITDQTGRNWDISHAVAAYDMTPEYFNFGIGLGAIPSVDTPVVVEKDDPQFPQADDDFMVFGVDHNNRQRAYSVTSLTNHEVFNDIYPGTALRYVSVAY